MTIIPNIKDPKFLLVFPPLQYRKDEMIRPDGTLALPYLDASLTEAGFQSQILDMSIGTSKDRLDDTFYRKVSISAHLVRVGMSSERILEEVQDFDVIAITSIFTQQTSRVFEISKMIKENYPEKILIAGGVNARSLKEHFFNNGFDVIFLSEGEKAIVDFAKLLHFGTPSLSDIDGIAFKKNNKTIVNPSRKITTNLDDIPIPSWEKLPNDQYWEISRIWGGRQGWIEHAGLVRYAAIFTSRGCPFTCQFCHISKETSDETGNIAGLRLHSIERVEQELERLESLSIDYVFINDDTFLAKKNRVFFILKLFKEHNFKIADVNGVNIIHCFKRHKGKLVVDEELLEALYDAGFRKLSLPFESGNQRIIDKYASGKWNIDKCDTVDLVRKLNKIGIWADGNFMIGFPDETLEELTNTFLLAKKMMDAGMVGCGFFMAQPFPGSVLYDESIANGQLSKSWHWDELGWSKGSPFNNLKIDKELLKYTWSLVWKLLNPEERVEEFTEQFVYNTEGDS